jgi:hypothetical protein
VDVREPGARAAGVKTPLYFGALLQHPGAWRTLPHACELVYFVLPDQVDEFVAESAALCLTTPTYVLLPP